ncbi:MAG: hypothetical protein AVDCRST_MAG49-4657 [uncultured Thermomicrobiales bacterium]|uniref:Uncharacterized protein n=1 Tax=uncultured Thermomicrobiales bacterium TaxID=1645740 RepID=A0A6J4VM81_9BACT|nr:MAG: hypothetical protein AVDCRST_MAG49-4657 [uncultured Thermomicrobiales bacterium]
MVEPALWRGLDHPGGPFPATGGHPSRRPRPRRRPSVARRVRYPFDFRRMGGILADICPATRRWIE